MCLFAIFTCFYFFIYFFLFCFSPNVLLFEKRLGLTKGLPHFKFPTSHRTDQSQPRTATLSLNFLSTAIHSREGAGDTKQRILVVQGVEFVAGFSTSIYDAVNILRFVGEVRLLSKKMSWAKEEWKQELSANALNKVYDLEQRYETLQKDSKQKQFQLDSLQAALAKQKKLTEDEKANASSMKKENHSLSESLQELERNREKILHDLNAKEGQIRCLEGKFARCQQQLDGENAKGVQLKNELDHLQYDHNQIVSKLEKQTADFNKAKEATSLLQRQLAGTCIVVNLEQMINRSNLSGLSLNFTLNIHCS